MKARVRNTYSLTGLFFAVIALTMGVLYTAKDSVLSFTNWVEKSQYISKTGGNLSEISCVPNTAPTSDKDAIFFITCGGVY